MFQTTLFAMERDQLTASGFNLHSSGQEVVMEIALRVIQEVTRANPNKKQQQARWRPSQSSTCVFGHRMKNFPHDVKKTSEFDVLMVHLETSLEGGKEVFRTLRPFCLGIWRGGKGT